MRQSVSLMINIKIIVVHFQIIICQTRMHRNMFVFDVLDLTSDFSRLQNGLSIFAQTCGALRRWSDSMQNNSRQSRLQMFICPVAQHTTSGRCSSGFTARN